MKSNIIITNQSATVVYKGKPYTVSRDHHRFEDLLDAYNSKDEKKLGRVIDSLAEVKKWSEKHAQGNVTIENGAVLYKGVSMENAITKRILDWAEMDLDPAPMINFLERILNNPSYQSREELLLFLEHGNLPITEDGRFLAYKVIRENYTDKHTGTMDNSIGTIVEMDRSNVDDNRQNTCSKGLHFCSKDYVQHFSNGTTDRLVLLAVDPADVVSIPYDYNNTKGRACKYEILEEVEQVTQKFDSPLYTPEVKTYHILATCNEDLIGRRFGLVCDSELFEDFEEDVSSEDLVQFKTQQEAVDYLNKLTVKDMMEDGFGTDLTLIVKVFDSNNKEVAKKIIQT